MVENELAKVKGKSDKEIQVKSERVLRKWLGLPARYRDPATSGHVTRKGDTDGV